MPKTYPLPVVISAYTGIMVTDKFQDIHELFEYLVGGSVWTHQLPRVQEECAPWLLRRHPFLADVDASQVNKDNWREWINAEISKYGNDIEVDPIPKDEHKIIDPIKEAQEMNPDIKVIGIPIE